MAMIIVDNLFVRARCRTLQRSSEKATLDKWLCRMGGSSREIVGATLVSRVVPGHSTIAECGGSLLGHRRTNDNSMALDQVRQASKVLGPLLRRRGTTPALGTSLRRALQALDKSFSGLSAQAQAETIDVGIVELRACVELIRQSDRPADHEQLDGIEKALALLGPAEVSLPVAAIPPPAPANGAEIPGRSSAARPNRARQAAAMPAVDFASAGLLLVGYHATLQTLHLVMSEPLFRQSDLDNASAELDKRARALQWLGKERIPEILRFADESKNTSERLAAGAALVHLGDAHGAEMVIGVLGKAAADKQPLPESGQTLLRVLGERGVAEWLLQVFHVPVHPAVCGLLLPLLAERNLLPAEELWQLAKHARDEIAVEAALALPWSDGPFDTQALVAWSEQARTARRANALLFAASTLGSAVALAQVRARVQAGETIDPLLVDALAVAGDASDAARLTALAREADDEQASMLLLAAGHLGSPATLADLASFEESVPADVLAEVRRLIVGEGDRRGRDDGRLLRGRPWSVAELLARLQSSEESLQAQRWLALELRARTGEVPMSSLPVLLPPSARPELLANWSSYYAKANGKLKPGQWYYQGKPMREMSV
jgi:hypothetical protein